MPRKAKPLNPEPDGTIPAPFIAFFGGSSATTGCEWIFDCWIETRPRVMEKFPNGR